MRQDSASNGGQPVTTTNAPDLPTDFDVVAGAQKTSANGMHVEAVIEHVGDSASVQQTSGFAVESGIVLTGP